jgi:hypothetical protein
VAKIEYLFGYIVYVGSILLLDPRREHSSAPTAKSHKLASIHLMLRKLSAVEMVAVDPHDLQAAQDRDAGTPPPPITDAENIQPK